jgi:hypothetical protein
MALSHDRHRLGSSGGVNQLDIVIAAMCCGRCSAWHMLLSSSAAGLLHVSTWCVLAGLVWQHSPTTALVQQSCCLPVPVVVHFYDLRVVCSG